MNETTISNDYKAMYSELQEKTKYRIAEIETINNAEMQELKSESERLSRMYDELKAERNRFVIQMNEQAGQIKAYEYVIERMFDK